MPQHRRFARSFSHALVSLGLVAVFGGCSSDSSSPGGETQAGNAGAAGAETDTNTGRSGSTQRSEGGGAGDAAGESSVAGTGGEAEGGAGGVEIGSGGRALGGGGGVGGVTQIVGEAGASTPLECEDGYHLEGDACVIDQETASCADADPCSAHGTCDDASGVVVCICEVGYAGVDCADCAAGFHEDDGECLLDQQCLSSTCSGRGACSVVDGTVSCDCSVGHTGTYCEDCAEGYHPTARGICEADETCQSDSCLNGTCSVTSGVVSCACEAGWSGEACNQCAAGFHLEGTECLLDAQCIASTCSGHGSCTVVNGQIACACYAGYDGDYCEDCATGYHTAVDGACAADQLCTTSSCTGHGACSVNGGVASCACDAGWAGSDCSSCAPGFHLSGEACVLDTECLPSTCSYAGLCAVGETAITCSCNTGYVGTYCQNCATGYHRSATTNACIPNETCTNSTCSGHGSCSVVNGETSCICSTGWAGSSCSSCAPGYHLSGGSCVADTSCQVTSCSYQGTCSASSGSISCSCNAGYAGTYCQSCAANYRRASDNTCVPYDTCTAGICGGHGTCSVVDGVRACSCDPGYVTVSNSAPCAACAAGYSPDASDVTLCTRDTECLDSTCAGNGACKVLADNSLYCDCADGYDSAVNCAGCSPGYTVNEVTGRCEVPCDEWGSESFRCESSCVNHGEEHCGSCGLACEGAETCIQLGQYRYDCACLDTLCQSGDGESCVDLETDEAHCGACGNDCGEQFCVNGTCTDVSQPPEDCDYCTPEYGRVWCGGAENTDGECMECLSMSELLFNDEHCGDCATVCAEGQRCLLGECVAVADAPVESDCYEYCTVDNGYVYCGEPDATDCGSECVYYSDFRYDPTHCGGCGIECGSLETCDNGRCVCQWDEAPDGVQASVCGSECFDLRFDDAHCGSCDKACAATEDCLNGACVATEQDPACSGTQTLCDGVCLERLSFQSDPAHCGGCDACPSGEPCTYGLCACTGAYEYCSVEGVNLCVNTQNEPEHCGSCGASCGAHQACSGAECYCTEYLVRFVNEEDGWWSFVEPGTCDGACIDLSYDEAHCGACGAACAAGEVCLGGNCFTPGDETDCEGTEERDYDWDETFDETRAETTLLGCGGSCVDPYADPFNCGGCGVVCELGYACNSGNCQRTGELCSLPLERSSSWMSLNVSGASSAEGNYSSACGATEIETVSGESTTTPPQRFVSFTGTPGLYRVYLENMDASCQLSISAEGATDACNLPSDVGYCVEDGDGETEVAIEGPVLLMLSGNDCYLDFDRIDELP